MVNWNDVLTQRERYKDLLREAERARLVSQAPAGDRGKDRLHRRALTWLGLRLIAWGCYLQERYGVTDESPAPCVENGICCR